MLDKKIGILEHKDFSKEALLQLENIGKVELYMEENNLREFIKDKEIIFVRLK